MPESLRTSGTIHNYSIYQEVGKQDLLSREKTIHTDQPLKDPDCEIHRKGTWCSEYNQALGCKGKYVYNE